MELELLLLEELEIRFDIQVILLMEILLNILEAMEV